MPGRGREQGASTQNLRETRSNLIYCSFRSAGPDLSHAGANGNLTQQFEQKNRYRTCQSSNCRIPEIITVDVKLEYSMVCTSQESGNQRSAHQTARISTHKAARSQLFLRSSRLGPSPQTPANHSKRRPTSLTSPLLISPTSRPSSLNILMKVLSKTARTHQNPRRLVLRSTTLVASLHK